MRANGLTRKIGAWILLVLFFASPLLGGGKSKSAPAPAPPSLSLDGGRRLDFVRVFSSDTEVRTRKSIWSRVVDLVAGAPEIHHMSRPYDVTTDSRGRVIVTDPGTPAVHIFDFQRQKYQMLEGSRNETFKSPIGVAVDSADNIYVADSELGKVLVFDPQGKFRRYIGDVKGEGFFKRPTGIAVDPAHERIYITDTLRNAVYFADLQGNILGHFGQSGSGDGEFNYPSEIIVRGEEVLVVDAMNFRVQLFTLSGQYRSQFGRMGAETGSLFRSKGLALDSEGDVYIADGFNDIVQVFDRQGELLYYFGGNGRGSGEFQMPAGVHIDSSDKIYVVDSFNRRVQVFQFVAAGKGSRSGN